MRCTPTFLALQCSWHVNRVLTMAGLSHFSTVSRLGAPRATTFNIQQVLGLPEDEFHTLLPPPPGLTLSKSLSV